MPSEEYQGFEQGPIRPPSEASSLLLRITRNCPWNRCTFCSVYKGKPFSQRPVEDVLEDIDRIHTYVQAIKAKVGHERRRLFPADISGMLEEEPADRVALNAALNWVAAGMKSIFLQDANSLIIKPERLITILRHLQSCFPHVERITSYARSHTIARISDDDLRRMYEAGLTRIHIGMESGSDKVLALIKKGVDKETHIRAGLKVKQAGMELSEYLMPGLGGRELSEEHARESADALNRINPDFIRLRTLALPERSELCAVQRAGNFQKMTDTETAAELLLFLQSLDGITSTLKSDHILNLFEDLEGDFPEARQRMVGMVQTYLKLDPYEQMIYQVGRRMGLYRGLGDMGDMSRRAQVEGACRNAGIHPDNVSQAIDELMRRFV